jgi:hypothetical protein
MKNRLVEDKELMVAGSDAYQNSVNNITDIIPVNHVIPYTIEIVDYNIDYIKLGSPFFVRKSGVYIIFFVISTDTASQFTIFVNGEVQPSTCVGSNAGAGQIVNRCMLKLQENDNILVRNYISTSASVLSTIGAGGKGTPELLGVGERVDIYTGTFGKALGGAAGGYVSGRASIVELLRQKARPYLFSNSLAPVIAAGSLEAIRIASDLTEGPLLRSKLQENTKLFRELMLAEGFNLLPGDHPIIPVMFGDARLATEVANRMFIEGIYVTAFSFPVVPRDKARIRVQLSAAHSTEEIKTCVAAFRNARAQVRME